MAKQKSWWIRFREKLRVILQAFILEEISEWIAKKKNS